jgi:uncharacterized protein YegL
MATGKIVGQIQVTEGDIKILGVDGSVREPGFEGYLYENEQVISEDPTALFQIKFLALPEASAYTGVFRILADGSVIHGRDAMESIASDESLVEILETAEVKEDSEDLETAAGEEEAEGSTAFTETDIVADSSVLGFNRGENSELGFGITDFGGEKDTYDGISPAITSPNIKIYDENGTDPIMQVTARGESDLTYSISGLDSDLFNIDATTGILTFKNSPDYEAPQDSDEDNEYNMYVTVTDTLGNYTTQLLSVSVNNVNEPVTAYDDTVDAVEDTVISSTIDLDANDYDIDGDDLTVVAGTYDTAQGGTIVIAADGSYTYTPAANFNGVDSVEYTVTDGEFSDVGMLTINVSPANDAPVAVDDTVNAVEDTIFSSTIDLDANDYDIDGDDLTVVAGTYDTTQGGTIVIASDGSYTYTPAANFNGVDSVDYTVTDGELSDVGMLTINVSPANDAPSILVSTENGDVLESGIETIGSDPDLGDRTADGTFTIGDVDGLDDISSITIAGHPFTVTEADSFAGVVGQTVSTTYGEVTINSYNGNGVFAYTYELTNPTSNPVAQDSFSVAVSDGTASATGIITMNIVDDAPIAYDNSVTLLEGTTTGSVTNLLFMLDVSGSMAGSNLAALKASSIALLEAYQANGGFNVQFVTFDTEGHAATVVYSDLGAAATYINSLSAGGWTNYEDAVNDSIVAWDIYKGSNPSVNSTNSVAYFISDGEPNVGDEYNITDPSGLNWNGYVDNNFSKAIAVGMGSNPPSDPDLKIIAHTPGGPSGDADDEIYTAGSGDELTSILVGTVVQPTMTGNVITDAGFDGTDLSGADGFDTPALVSVTYDDGDSSTPDTHTFTDTTTPFTIVTDAGTVVIKGDGSYTFTSLTNVGDDVTDIITYMIKDSDGSIHSADLVLKTVDSSEVTAVGDTVTIVSDTIVGTGIAGWNDSGSDVYLTNGGKTVTLDYDDSPNTLSTTSQSFDVAQTGLVKVYIDNINNVNDGDWVKVELMDGSSSVAEIKMQWETSGTDGWIITEDGSVTWSGDYNDKSGWITFNNVSVDNYNVRVSAYKLDATFSNLTYPAAITTSDVWDNVGMTSAPVTDGEINGNLFANDSLGSEGAAISEIVGSGSSTTVGNLITVDGEYGVLTVNTYDGTYNYELTSESVPTGVTDTFTYTLAQTDGDSSTAYLNINFASSVGDTGTADADTLVASVDTGVTISGGDGNDHIIGGAGDDTLNGDAGSDTLEGGAGSDTLDGGIDSDALFGGAGDDMIIADSSDSIIDGGTGTDTLFLANDTLDLSNVSNIEIIQLGGNSTVTGSSPDLGINVADVISASGGGNTLIIETSDSDGSDNTVNVDLSEFSFDSNAGGYDFYTNFDDTVTLQIEDTIDVI